MRYFFLLFAILYIDFIFVFFLKMQFGKALPLTISLFFLLTFICGALGNLSLYKYALILILAISLFFVYKKKSLLIEALKNYFGYSIILFVIVYFFFIYLFRNVGLSNIDDLSYWSLAVNGIVKTGKLYSINQFTMSYPPFTTWYISIICYVLGGYEESRCLFAISLLFISFVLPVIDNFKMNKKNTVLVMIVFLTLIASLLCVNIVNGDNKIFVFNSIYLDWVISVVYAYGFYSIFTYKDFLFDRINVSAVFSILILIKQVTFPLFLVVSFTTVIRIVIKKEFKLRDLFYIVVIPLIMYFLWSGYYGMFSATDALSTNINVASHGLSTECITNGSDTIKSFLKEMFTGSIVSHPFKLSYFWFVTIMFVFSIIYYFFSGKKKEDLFTLICLYLGSFGYALVMLICYLVVFSDGYTLPLFSRYMQSYTFAYLLVVVFMFLSNIDSIKKALMVFTIVCFFVEPASITTIVPSNNPRIIYKEQREKMKEYLDYIYNGEKTLIITQTQFAYGGAIYSAFVDKDINLDVKEIGINESSVFTVKWFEDLLNEFELIYICDYDDYFAKEFWYKISNVPLYNSTLYRINHSEEDISFTILEVWE